MCKCTPEIKTPFCGKGDCQWPKNYLGIWFPSIRPADAPVMSWKKLDSDIEAFIFLHEHKKEGAKVYKEIKLNLEVV